MLQRKSVLRAFEKFACVAPQVDVYSTSKTEKLNVNTKKVKGSVFVKVVKTKARIMNTKE